MSGVRTGFGPKNWVPMGSGGDKGGLGFGSGGVVTGFGGTKGGLGFGSGGVVDLYAKPKPKGGGGMMIDAPHTGSSVRVERVSTFGGYMGARRYG